MVSMHQRSKDDRTHSGRGHGLLTRRPLPVLARDWLYAAGNWPRGALFDARDRDIQPVRRIRGIRGRVFACARRTPGRHCGRSAAWSIGVYEAPLFYACDTMPLSAIDLGRLSSRNSVEVAETELDLPKETCSIISVLLGEWILRRNRLRPLRPRLLRRRIASILRADSPR